MRPYVVLFSAVVLLVFIYFTGCYFAARYAMKRKRTRTRQDYEKILHNDTLCEDVRCRAERIIKRIDALSKLTSKVYSIKSFDGLELKMYYAPCKEDTDTAVLLVHGYDSDAHTAFGTIAEHYVSKGFDVFVIDQRACGKSEGTCVSFGINESRDVVSWYKFIKENFPSLKKIFLHGISLGGATVLLSLKDHELSHSVSCVVADCGFDSPERILDHVLKNYYHLPSFMRKTVIFFCGRICKCDFRGVNTEDILKNCDVPILFLHGDLDTYVPYDMSVSNFNASKRPFELYTVKGARHAGCFTVDEQGSYSAVDRLLNYALKKD